jgi:single-strand DNA-binding protein
MINETQITVIGNVTADPELRFTQAGRAVANFAVAVTPRTFDKTAESWLDGTTAFHRVTAWGRLGENVAEFVQRGKRVIVTGSLGQRDWQDKEGNNRSSFELTASAVGLDLTYLKPVTPVEETTEERPPSAPKATRRQHPMKSA